MKRMPRTTGTMMMPSSMVSGPLVHAGLERLELGIDLLGRTQLGDLFLEGLGFAAQAGRIGASFGEVDPAFEHVEAREGVAHLRAIGHFAETRAVVGALQPSDDRVLADARLAQLV